MTPLLPAPALGADLGIERLLIKDDGLLPTGSFKARGAAVGVSKAGELGARRLAMPTNGNAGAAWSAYAARAGLDDARGDAARGAGDHPCRDRRDRRRPVARRRADLRRGPAGGRGHRGESRTSWFDVATLKEPYRIEGKKTMGFEIAEQLGWRMPDVIVYPTGGGVGLIGIHKALNELLSAGLGRGRPAATGLGPVHRLRSDRQGVRGRAPASREPWVDARTVAFGLTVPEGAR